MNGKRDKQEQAMERNRQIYDKRMRNENVNNQRICLPPSDLNVDYTNSKPAVVIFFRAHFIHNHVVEGHNSFPREELEIQRGKEDVIVAYVSRPCVLELGSFQIGQPGRVAVGS